MNTLSNPNAEEAIRFIGTSKSDGIYTYSGEPFSDKNALDTIGIEGINFIHRRIQEIINWKKYIYGEGSEDKQHLNELIEFAHLPSRAILWVSDIKVDDYRKGHLGSKLWFTNEEENVTSNPKLLQTINHYLIWVKYVAMDEEPFGHYIANRDPFPHLKFPKK